MSSTPVETPVDGARRVRDQARDAVVVMGFSLGMSATVALAVLLLTRLGH